MFFTGDLVLCVVMYSCIQLARKLSFNKTCFRCNEVVLWSCETFSIFL